MLCARGVLWLSPLPARLLLSSQAVACCAEMYVIREVLPDEEERESTTGALGLCSPRRGIGVWPQAP